MAAGRTLRSLISRRRRAAEDGEDEEEGPVVVEDSQSEGSVLSDPEDEEGEGSSLGIAADADVGAGAVKVEKTTSSLAASTSKTKSPRKPRKRASHHAKDGAHDTARFKTMDDTEAMMNGLNISEQSQTQVALDFENMDSAAPKEAATTAGAANGHEVSPVEKQRRDHEDYKRKRDSNPAFIPNRGNFFMHDTRGQPNGQLREPPLRGTWQARGRGRGAISVGGPFSPANRMAQAERAAEQPWKHDLHDTINEEPQNSAQSSRISNNIQLDPNFSANTLQQPTASSAYGRAPIISFSSTTLVGKVQIRVLLPGMKAPVVFSEIPWKHYTRLPDHRPPLRRDKPVRVFLPGHAQKLIWPSPERSFIFIPRQNRPNPSGFHRGNYQRSIGGYGYSSRRTSMYGGSVYSGSRRSSLAGISRDNAFSPVGSINGMMSRPVVKLPYGSHYSGVSTPVGPLSGHQTPTGMPQMHNYPPPQQPAHYGTAVTTVYHPRPQKGKAISIDGIESPMLQQEPQPFQNQLPAHMNEAPPQYFSPQHMLPPSQPQSGTPLVDIPEQAVHAPNFQTPAYGQPAFYMPYPAPQNMYYSAPVASGYPPPSVYVQPHHSYIGPPPGQMMPPPPPPPQQQTVIAPQSVPQPARSTEDQSQRSQSGMVAHESNGMVFYVPASEAQQSEQYQPAESFVPSYAMSGLPPPTPPESTTYYYPSVAAGMHEVGTALYYPAQPQQ